MRINKYLKEKLTPLIDEISVSMTDSLQLKIFGIEDDSKQSILIQMGNVWETNEGRQELIDFLEKKGYTVSKKKKPKIKT